ncbi:MAG TPA: TonB-dependent receptor [Caulobacteraceae bacterium]|jgi:outer membrane receptor protein involved in Fe transport
MRLAALTVLLCTVAPHALAQTGTPGQTEPAASPSQPPTATPQTERDEATGQNAAAPTPATAEAPAAAAGQGVLSYPASFFAASQPGTALDMIQRLPGFSFDSGDQVRGFGGAAGNVLIDGERPSAKAEGVDAVLARLPAGRVERIDLIRGGAPGIDMQGQAVVANVVLKTEASRSLVVTHVQQFRPDGRWNPQIRFTPTHKAGRLTLDGSLLLYQTESDEGGEGEYRLTDAAGGLLQEGPFYNKTPVQGVEANAKAEFKRSPTDTFRVSGLYKLQDVEQHERAEFVRGSQAGGAAYLTYGSIRHDAEIGADWDHVFGPRTTLKLLALQTIRDRKDVVTAEENGSVADVTDDTFAGESIVRGVLAFRRSDTLAFETGAEAAFNFLEGASTLVVDGEPVDLPSANVRVEELRGEAFGTATWKPSPRWSFEAGSRFETSTISQSGDVTSEKSFFFAKPRVLATFAPGRGAQFRVRLEREVGQLDFGDFVSSAQLATGTVDAGNPDLEPQRSWVFEATYEQRFWDKGALVATYTHGAIEAATDLVPVLVDSNQDGVIDDFFDAPGNLGEATRDTLELNLTLPLDRLGVPGGLLRTWRVWNVSEVTDPTTGQARRLSGQHPYDWEVKFSQDLTRWRSTWGLEAYGSFQETYYRINEVRRVEYDTYYMAFLEHRPSPTVSIRGELANFTGRENRLIRTIYSGPRNTDGVEAVESRSRAFSPFVHLRVRKTFGG